MGTYYGSSIPTGTGSTAQRTHLVDDLLTPRLFAFRQIHIHDEEPVKLLPDNVTLKLTFGNLCQAAPLEIIKSGKRCSNVDIATVDYPNGQFTFNVPMEIGPDGIPLDTVSASYVWDYFPQPVLEGLLLQAMAIVNTQAYGATTYYTLEGMPTPWEGVVTDLAYAGALDRLLMDYNLWRGRMVFSIGPEQVESGSDNIPSQLQILKSAAEERANKVMANEKFKCGEYVAHPSRYYYEGVRGMAVSGAHGIPFAGGPLNGFINTKII